MPTTEEVIEDARREVKAIGDDVKKLQDAMQKDLAAVRKLAEDAEKKADASSENAKKLEALTAGVTEKLSAVDSIVEKIKKEALEGAQARLDEIEKRMNRLKTSVGVADDEQKLARTFAETKAALKRTLKPGETLPDEAIDVAEYKAYAAGFRRMISNAEGKHGLTPDEIKAMSVGSDPDGGYWVTPAVSSRIMMVIRESSPLEELATVETIGGAELEIPIDEDEADAGWGNETLVPSTTGTPRVGVQTIPVHLLWAKPKATQQFIEDAGRDVAAWLGGKVGEKFGRMAATAYISGSGVSRPRGILTYPAGTARGQLEQVISGHATLVTFDGLINLITALKGFYKANASFLMKRTTIGAVMLLKDGNGQYLWRPDNTAGQPSRLLGYPVREAEDMATVGAGALAIAFGDFRRGYTVVRRLGMTTLVDPYSAKPFVEFFTRARVGGDVTNFEAIKLQRIAAA